MPRRRTSGPVRQWAEYLGFRFLLLSLNWLDWPAQRALGRWLGRFTGRVVRLRWRVTIENLRVAFPNLSSSEWARLARRSYEAFGITFLELLQLHRLKRGEASRRVHFDEPDEIGAALAEGRGVVVWTGHFGNWELVGAAVADRGRTISALVRTQRNARIDRFVTRARESAGYRVLRVESGLRPVLHALKRNEVVAFVGDQDAGRDGIFLPFLGREASWHVGPARFARLAGCPIVAGFAARQADGRYRMEALHLLRVRTDLPPEEAELEVTRQLAALLEEAIERYPEQWFWMHRRWKSTRPERSGAQDDGASRPSAPGASSGAAIALGVPS